MKRFMGISLTPRRISAAVINEEFRKESMDSWELSAAERNSEGIIERIVQAAQSQPLLNACVAVGVALPALIHRNDGKILYAPDFPGLEGVQLQREITNRMDHPILLDSLGNATLAGESLGGAAAGHPNIIGVYLGNHVWGGILMDGHLWRGPLGLAGQIGQVVVNPAGSRCGWSGVQGALDVYASGDGLRGHCIAHPVNSVDSEAADMFLELTTAAEASVGAAEGHLRQMGQALGQALASVINFTEISKVLIAGPGKVGFNWFEESLKDELNRSCLDVLRSEVELIGASLGGDAALIGAAYNWQLQAHA